MKRCRRRGDGDGERDISIETGEREIERERERGGGGGGGGGPFFLPSFGVGGGLGVPSLFLLSVFVVRLVPSPPRLSYSHQDSQQLHINYSVAMCISIPIV